MSVANQTHQRPVEVSMLACDPAVLAAVWKAVEPIIPVPVDTHPLGCHRRRVNNFVAFKGIIARIVTGCSWEVAGWAVGTSESTLLRRRSEWLRAGVLRHLAAMGLCGLDREVECEQWRMCID